MNTLLRIKRRFLFFGNNRRIVLIEGFFIENKNKNNDHSLTVFAIYLLIAACRASRVVYGTLR